MMRNSNENIGIETPIGQQWVAPEYDRAGNITVLHQPDSPAYSFHATYDAWNRLVRLTAPAAPPESSSSSSSSASSVSSALNSSSSSSSTSSSSSSEPEEMLIAEYEYDARRFRIRERTYTEGVLSETRDVYFTESWQAIEERIPPQTFPWAERQCVWGIRYIDDCVLRDRFTFGGGLADRFYALQDANWNVIAITDDEGDVQERYAYSAYGAPTFLQPDYTPRGGSQFDWRHLFTGLYLSPSTELLHARNRECTPSLGVWSSRDPEQYADGMNLFDMAFVPNGSDPFGLADWVWPWDSRASWNIHDTASLWTGGRCLTKREVCSLPNRERNLIDSTLYYGAAFTEGLGQGAQDVGRAGIGAFSGTVVGGTGGASIGGLTGTPQGMVGGAVAGGLTGGVMGTWKGYWAEDSIDALSLGVWEGAWGSTAAVGPLVTEGIEQFAFAQIRTFLRAEAGVASRAAQNQIIGAFNRGARVRPYQGQAYQYSGLRGSQSRWLTPHPVADPIRDLALPPSNPAALLQQYRVCPTNVIQGTVAPQTFGIPLPGGARQIYVPTRSVLVPTPLLPAP